MNEHFDQLVIDLTKNSLSNEVVHQLTSILKQKTNNFLSQFLSDSYQSLVELEYWAWQVLSQYSQQYFKQINYQDLFYTLALFNKYIIFNNENIQIDQKATILFSVSIDQINSILKRIEHLTDEYDPFITIVNLWFDNHSHFLHENPHYQKLLITNPLNQYISCHYIMSKEFKFYLTYLRETNSSQLIFTPKMLFYLNTCLCSLFSYLGAETHQFPYTLNSMLHYLTDDYLQIIQTHYYLLENWTDHLLGCIGHLMGVIAKCYWYDEKNGTQMKILFPTEQILCIHVEQLIRILSYESFLNKIKSLRINNETILIDSILMILMNIVQIENINWFFRSNTIIQNTLLNIANKSHFDEICLRAYTILGEVATDEQLKEMNIAYTMAEFLFNMLEQAWQNPSKEYKQIPIKYLLKDFQILSRNDSIQQTTANLNKLPFLIEISQQYEIIYHIFWALSFNENIQEQFRSNSSFMSTLIQLAQTCNEKEIRKIIHGILWNLEINHENHLKSNILNDKSFDLMISYSHKNKEICKQIYQELVRNNFRVWIDFDQMHGNIMDAMAQAIESSSTIIICMSEEYRKSNYCRAEAHYAFQQQKKIVPILLQKHYKPDSWLLFLIGQLIYIDFTKYEFDQAINMLLKEFKPETNSEITVIPIPLVDDIDCSCSNRTVSVVSIRSDNILEWTQIHVQDWLSEHNLMQIRRLFVECDGRSLVNLMRYMKYGNIQQILNSLQEDSIRRTNENLSYIELSIFQSLMTSYCLYD